MRPMPDITFEKRRHHSPAEPDQDPRLPQRELRALAVALVAVTGAFFASSGEATEPSAPEPVSPGALERPTSITTVCPTFTWGLPEDLARTARGLDLVVYQLNDRERAEVDPVAVLTESLTASARAWTPSSDRCLEAGGAYAWTLGATGKGPDRLWGETALFRIVDLERMEAKDESLSRPATRIAGSDHSANETHSETPDRVPKLEQPKPGRAGLGSLQALLPEGTSALVAELDEMTGVTFGVQGLSHSPDGFGLAGVNDNGGVGVAATGGIGLLVPLAGGAGVHVASAADGLQIAEAQDNGIVVNEVGAPTKTNAAPGDGAGFRLDGAENVGMWIGFAGQAGINIEEVGDAATIAPAIRVGSATGPGLVVEEVGIGVKIDSALTHGILISESFDDGVEIVSTFGHGMHVGTTNEDGLHVDTALGDGVHIASASDDGIEVHTVGLLGHGVHVAEASEHGLFVANAGVDGLHIAGFGDTDPNGVGIFVSNGDVTDKAAHFDGAVEVVGTLTKGAGTFKIDHPVDPENRYLSHSFVESPEMMNVYNGNVVLDGKGRSTVQMPEWFEALNREFRYQLTPIGAPGPNLYVAREIKDNVFEIAGGEPGSKVSWQLTGVRRDAYAEAHRTEVEAWKKPEDRGYFLHPAAFGLPLERGIAHARLARRTPAQEGAEPAVPIEAP